MAHLFAPSPIYVMAKTTQKVPRFMHIQDERGRGEGGGELIATSN